ncbi:MAG: alpha/beta fold hydrolase [Terriglobales bacterium]
MLEAALPCGRLCYRAWGEGPDVVLLHGMLGCSRQWEAAATLLGRSYRCWALELPGIGASAPAPDMSLRGLSRWLEWACAALPLASPWHLAGSSWGGALALHAAALSPMRARLRGLILAAPAHPLWRLGCGQRVMLTPLAARAGAWLGAHASTGVHRALLERIYGDPTRVLPGSVADYARTLRRPHLGAAVAAYSRHFQHQQDELRSACSTLAMPVLLVWGDRDPVVPAATAPALQAALPRATLKLLPGLGHLPFVEDPQAFAAAVLPFLS